MLIYLFIWLLIYSFIYFENNRIIWRSLQLASSSCLLEFWRMPLKEHWEMLLPWTWRYSLLLRSKCDESMIHLAKIPSLIIDAGKEGHHIVLNLVPERMVKERTIENLLDLPCREGLLPSSVNHTHFKSLIFFLFSLCCVGKQYFKKILFANVMI